MSQEFLLPPKTPHSGRYAPGSRTPPQDWTVQQELLIWPVCASVSSLGQLSAAVEFLAPLVEHDTRCGEDQKLTPDQEDKNRIDMFWMRAQTRHMGMSHNCNWPRERRDRFHSWAKSLHLTSRCGPLTWGEKYFLQRFRGKTQETSWVEDVEIIVNLLDRDPYERTRISRFVESTEKVNLTTPAEYVIPYNQEASRIVARFLESDRDTDLMECLNAWAGVRAYFSPPEEWQNAQA